MKMTRNILRRLEMKIHHAMTLDQIRKQGFTEAQPKPENGKGTSASAMLPSAPQQP